MIIEWQTGFTLLSTYEDGLEWKFSSYGKGGRRRTKNASVEALLVDIERSIGVLRMSKLYPVETHGELRLRVSNEE